MDGGLAFFCGAVPIMLAAAFNDLRTMKIPNWISVALLVVFVLVGLSFLPIETLAWRLAAGFGMLVFTFMLNQMGQMGGGDAKLLAACTPYIAFPDIPLVMYIFAASLLVMLAVHQLARIIPPVRQMAPDWVSWQDRRMFPKGIAIAATLIVYLYLKI